jgi:hypothetical protein
MTIDGRGVGEHLERQLGPHLDRLDQAHAELHDRLQQAQAHRQRIKAAQGDVDRLLADIAMQGYDEPTLLLLARELYWNRPDVPVDSVGRLVGAKGNRVSEAVGPITILIGCGECGAECRLMVHSRSQLARAWQLCPPCREQRDRRMEASRMTQQQWEEERAEEARIRQERYDRGDYQVAGWVCDFGDGDRWIVPIGAGMDQAEPILEYPD